MAYYGLLNGFKISQPKSFRTINNSSSNANLGGGQYNIATNEDMADKEAENIPVNSTAIASARYYPDTDTVGIQYVNGGGKEYTFKAGGDEGVSEWVNAPSKGRITEEWRSTHYDSNWPEDSAKNQQS